MISKSATIADLLPLGIVSMNLGRAASHELEPKLKAAAECGIKGIEVFYEDLKVPARRASTSINGGSFKQNLIKSAQTCRDLCDKFNLEIICLQPFKNYEGLQDRQRHDEKIAKLEVWFKMAKILRDLEVLVADFRQLTHLGAEQSPPIRFVYEMMSWGAHVETWQQAWEVVKAVDHSNFGLCLDTYHILAQVWADCTSVSGIREDADKALQIDLAAFVRTVPLDKVFYIQLSDAERLSPPLSPLHPWYTTSQKPNMTWSRNARLFPLEQDYGAYMPVITVLQTYLFTWGYRGWISMEIFHRDLADQSEHVPLQYAQRAAESWSKIRKLLDLDRALE